MNEILYELDLPIGTFIDSEHLDYSLLRKPWLNYDLALSADDYDDIKAVLNQETAKSNFNYRAKLFMWDIMRRHNIEQPPGKHADQGVNKEAKRRLKKDKERYRDEMKPFLKYLYCLNKQEVAGRKKPARFRIFGDRRRDDEPPFLLLDLRQNFNNVTDVRANVWTSVEITKRSEDSANPTYKAPTDKELLQLDYDATLLQDDAFSDDDEDRLPLPPNLQSAFGGIDASLAIFSLPGFKPGLFDLSNADATKYTVPGDGGNSEYGVPSYLNLVWGSDSTFFSIVGESKREFARKLSSKVKLGGDLFGFGGEFERTFNEQSTQETFNKYMARYHQEVVYSVSFKDVDSASDYLTDTALDAFTNWTPEKIVSTFGTHFTVKATLGGTRIVSSTLDTRDIFTEKELTTAINMKGTYKDKTGNKVGSANAGGSETDKRSSQIFESMQVQNVHTLGGLAQDDESDQSKWRRSLISNPALVNFILHPIENLVPGDLKIKTTVDGKEVSVTKRELVKKAARAHIHSKAPIDHCSVLAMRVPLVPYLSDADCHATNADLTVAYPAAPTGWLRVGQFAQPSSWADAFKGQSYSWAVRSNPNLDLFEDDGDMPSPCPGVVAATNCDLKWSLTKAPFGRGPMKWGFFTPTYKPYNEAEIKAAYLKMTAEGKNHNIKIDTKAPLNDQYKPIGDIFEPANTVDQLKYDLNTSNKATWIWDDRGTGASTDCSLLALPISKGNKGPNDEKKLEEHGPETGDAWPIACIPRQVDVLKYPGHTLDWKKVQVLENKFLMT